MHRGSRGGRRAAGRGRRAAGSRASTSRSTPPSHPSPSSRSVSGAPPAGSAHAAQPGACTSRRPPPPFFRSGSSISAIGPGRSSRSAAAADERVEHPVAAARREVAHTARRGRSARSRSPATSRRSSSAVSASRSSSATASASFTVRTDWPEREAGVPQRVPERAGVVGGRRAAPTTRVQQHHVDVGTRASARAARTSRGPRPPIRTRRPPCPTRRAARRRPAPASAAPNSAPRRS